jgi:hypothetical protein
VRDTVGNTDSIFACSIKRVRVTTATVKSRGVALEFGYYPERARQHFRINHNARRVTGSCWVIQAMQYKSMLIDPNLEKVMNKRDEALREAEQWQAWIEAYIELLGNTTSEAGGADWRPHTDQAEQLSKKIERKAPQEGPTARKPQTLPLNSAAALALS